MNPMIRQLTLIDYFENKHLINHKEIVQVDKLFDYIKELDIDHLSDLFMDPDLEKLYFESMIYKSMINYQSYSIVNPINSAVKSVLDSLYSTLLESYISTQEISNYVTSEAIESLVEYCIDNPQLNVFILKNDFDAELIKSYFGVRLDLSNLIAKYPLIVNLNIHIKDTDYMVLKYDNN